MTKRINEYDYLNKKILFHVCVLHLCSVFIDWYSVLFLFYLTTCVCVCH